MTPERWRETIDTADQMMREAGVEIVNIKEKLGITIRFNGENVEV